EGRLADPFPAPDQPGMCETLLAIGRQHFRFGPLVADERINMAWMGRAGKRVGLRNIVRLALLRAGLAHARSREAGASEPPRPEAPRSGLEGRSRGRRRRRELKHSSRRRASARAP